MESTGKTTTDTTPAHRPLRVLLGDDDTGIRELLAEVLQEAGFEVILADSRRQAVEIFEQRGGHIDVVLLDMSRALPTAIEALTRLRATDAAAKVMLLTGNSRLDVVEETVSKGFNAFVPKPFTVGELLGPLRRLVGTDDVRALAA